MVGKNSIRWFNSAVAIHVKFKKPFKFILLAIGILSIKIVLSTIYGLFLPMLNIKPIIYNELVQISIQIYWDWLYALKLTAVPLTSL